MVFYNQSFQQCLLEKCWADVDEKISKNELYYFDIGFWISTTLLLAVGLPLNFGIIYHEWFGGDPQKRSLPNRFVSNAVLCDMLASLSIHTFTALLRSNKNKIFLANIVTGKTSFFRYSIGSNTLQTFFFKIFIGFTYATFWFGNAVTFIRFIQAVIWKRVMEINEDLVSAAVNRSILLVSGSLGLLCHPEFKLFGAISVLKGVHVDMPIGTCMDGIDPLHQTYVVNRNK